MMEYGQSALIQILCNHYGWLSIPLVKPIWKNKYNADDAVSFTTLMESHAKYDPFYSMEDMN